MDELQAFARSFPQPGPTFRSNSVIGPALGWLLRADDLRNWVLLHAGLTLGWFVLVAVMHRRHCPTERSWRLAVVVVAFSSPPTSLLRHLGGYDVFTLTGAVLVALGGSPWVVMAGGALVGATNVEQGLLALVGVVLVRAALVADISHRADGAGRATVKDVARGVAPALFGLVAARVAVLAWFAVLGADVEGRGDAFGRLVVDAVRNSIALGSTGLYGWLAVGWVVVVATVWRLRHDPVRWVAALTGLVLVPAVATVTTLDGTRVFGAVAAAGFLVALVALSREADRRGGSWLLELGAALMLFGWLVPAIDTTYQGGLRVPWRFWL